MEKKPMTPAEVVAWLRREANKLHTESLRFDAGVPMSQIATTMRNEAATLIAAADLIEALTASLEREESGHLATIDQRDAHEERINQIGSALGLDEDGLTWSNNSDVGENCIEAIETLTAERDEIARLAKSGMEMSQENQMRLREERDGLAGMVLAKDEALRDVLSNVDALEKQGSFGVNEQWAMDIKGMAHDAGDAALALSLPEAVAQVAGWRKERDRFAEALANLENDLDTIPATIWNQCLEAKRIIAAEEAENASE
jgi:hypothetical protein